MNIVKIDDPATKSQICEKVLRALPDWFGIESAIVDYVRDVQTMETWVAMDSEPIGFISINVHNASTAEIHIMGLLSEFHRKSIGQNLVRTAEESLRGRGCEFLSVKTLSESHPDENYQKTRKFYLKCGFKPVEEFKTLWDESNPCLLLIKPLVPQIGVAQQKDSVTLVRNFWQLFSDQKWPQAQTLLHPNFAANWPQSKERIVGPQNFIEVNKNYPGSHKIEVIHAFEVEDKVLTTVWIEADTGQKTFANSIFETKDGKIVKVEEYWAEPYLAPEWRKQWVEIL